MYTASCMQRVHSICNSHDNSQHFSLNSPSPPKPQAQPISLLYVYPPRARPSQAITHSPYPNGGFAVLLCELCSDVFSAVMCQPRECTHYIPYLTTLERGTLVPLQLALAGCHAGEAEGEFGSCDLRRAYCVQVTCGLNEEIHM